MKQKPYKKPTKVSSPISDHLISGHISTERGDFIIDYAHGMVSLDKELQVPTMPQVIVDNTPISLWNVALEVHTGRIFNHLVGPLYILYIPLFGIAIIIVLISGVVIWWLAYKKKKKKPLKSNYTEDEKFIKSWNNKKVLQILRRVMKSALLVVNQNEDWKKVAFFYHKNIKCIKKAYLYPILIFK